MSEEFIQNKEKLSFREIVLNHLNKVLEISRQEFMGGYWKQIAHGATTHTEYVPNSRKCYIQAVESLVDILYPYFDKQMHKEHDEILKAFKETFSFSFLFFW